MTKREVPDPLAVEDLISCKLNNKRKLARLITQYSAAGWRHIFTTVDYYWVAFSTELLEWGRTISDCWGNTVPRIYG